MKRSLKILLIFRKIMYTFRMLILFILSIGGCSLYAKIPYCLQFSIPECKIVKQIPEKDRDFAFLVPGDLKTYVYYDEDIYYRDYGRSFFAITRVKGGWDCMRHYEILASGAIPYFVDLDKCHPLTMAFLPKDLIAEAMKLPGVPHLTVNDTFNTQKLKIDHTKFDKKRYYEILDKLLQYTREFLTTKKMAEYVLKTTNYKAEKKILFLSYETTPDYMRCCTLIGLKELLGEMVIDYPKIPHIYTSYEQDVKKLYGRGFSYTKIVEDLPINRENIEERIRNKEFEIIIYGSVHRGMLFQDLVKQNYEPEKIFYMCGEDNHLCEFSSWNNLFLREFDALKQ